MANQPVKRKSHCAVCGKRLSEKTRSGEIRWQPSHVDDKGIYCSTCQPPAGNEKKRKVRVDSFA